MADVTDATFTTAVLDRSTEVTVIVDLWAPWCGPCRTLGPTIEQVVADTDGKVELAKVNVDENPQVSASFAVQSIPAVYAIRNRTVVDHFIGALPKAAVEQFVAGLLPSETESEVDRLLTEGDEASLRQALELAPAHTGVTVALAATLVEGGLVEEAISLLRRVPETAEVRALLAQARTAAVTVPDEDLGSQLDALLPQVKEDEGARQRYLDLLEVLGPDDPRTAGYRKALSIALF